MHIRLQQVRHESISETDVNIRLENGSIFLQLFIFILSPNGKKKTSFNILPTQLN